MSSDEIRVLLVEDNLGDARLLQSNLKGMSQSAATAVTLCERLADAVTRLRNETFDVILLDLSLPDSHGLDTIRKVQAAAVNLPIVVLTGADEALGMEAVRLGAQEYLVKGQIDGRGLVQAIRYSRERKRIEAELRAARDELELRVRQRTAELENAVTVLGQEVGDRERAEKSLRESEELFRVLVESLPAVVWVATPTFDRLLYCNAAYERIWGRTRASLEQNPRSWLDAVHPDDRSRVQGSLLKWMRDVQSGQVIALTAEFRIVRPDGGMSELVGRAVAVPDEWGAPRFLCGMYQDVHDLGHAATSAAAAAAGKGH